MQRGGCRTDKYLKYDFSWRMQPSLLRWNIFALKLAQGGKETSNVLHEGYCSLSSVSCHFSSCDLYFQHIDFFLTQPRFAEKRGIESLSCLHITIVHASLKVKEHLSGDDCLTDNVIRIVWGLFLLNVGGHMYQCGKTDRGRLESSCLLNVSQRVAGFARSDGVSDNVCRT